MSLFVKNKSRGFSVVEMIIVVGIIALMGSVVLVSMSKSRARGRDAKRVSDLKQLQLALTYYYDSAGTNGVKGYPSTSGIWNSSESGDAGVTGVKGGDWIPGLAPNYIDALPRNPGGKKIINASCNGAGILPAYRYKSDGQSYKLLAACSPEGAMSDTRSPFYDPIRPSWAWMICAGNTACTTW